MRYESTALPDLVSVDGIYTVLKVDFSNPGVGIGESHDFPELSFISKGEHHGIIDGKERRAVAGQLTVIAPDSFHKSARPSESEALIISFASLSPALNNLYNRLIDLTPSQEKALREIVEDGLTLFCRRAPGSEVSGMILREGADLRKLYKMKKALELFLVDLCNSYGGGGVTQSDRRRGADFNRAVRFLSENINRSLTISEIAEGASMSVSKLKLLFREKCGCGAMNYLIEMKIERAKELILEGKMNFSEISESLGYSSLHYFSRLFKKVSGLSPTEFRGSLKNEV